MRLTKEYKDKLKDQVKVYLRKYPGANLEAVKEFIKEGDPTVFHNVPRQQINSLLKYNMEKFTTHGTLDYQFGGGRPGMSQDLQDQIIDSCKNKRFVGTSRGAAAMYNVSQTTVLRVLKKGGLKSYSARPMQKMTGRQKMTRLVFAHYGLNTYGTDLTPQGTWNRLVNTDFSAGIKLTSSVNRRHDRVWATSEEAAGSLLDFPVDKHDISYMVWGGISSKGLIPADEPLFACEMKAEYTAQGGQLGARDGLTGNFYAWMIRNKAVPAVNTVFPDGNAVWQDDPASIHRTKDALEACKAFAERIPHDKQAAKCSDTWPIEQIWGILKHKVKRIDPKTKPELRAAIVSAWQEMNANKDMLRRMMESIPARLMAIIDRGGRQVAYSHYKPNEKHYKD